MINRLNILLLFIFLIYSSLIKLNGYANNIKHSQKITIDNINIDYCSLDEWKQPGRHSPLNAFDNKIETCFAEGYEGSGFIIRLCLKNIIKIDEVRIAAGYFKNDKLFKMNNRVKALYMSLRQKKKGNNPFIYDENIKFDNTFNLKDVKEYQNIRFGNYYYSKYITFTCLSIYKGSKYNDTCISDIQFYYKGKMIPVDDIEGAKRKYISDIQKKLKLCFSDKKYVWECEENILECNRNGTMKLTYDCIEEEGCTSGKKYEVLNLKWKVEKAKLYIKEKGKKWNLTKYIVADPDKLFAIDDSGTMLKGFFYLINST